MDGLNVYLYVGNNPVNHVDPEGLRKARYEKRWGGRGPDRLKWDLDDKEKAKIAELRSELQDLQQQRGEARDAGDKEAWERIQQGIDARRAYIDAIEGFTPDMGRPVGDTTVTFDFDEYETGKTSLSKTLWRGIKAGVSAGVWIEGGRYQSSRTIPQKAKDVLKSVQEKGSPPKGFKGGKIFENRDNKLPPGRTYKEYDIDPKTPSSSRTAERIVIDQESGQAWYTSDHYGTFQEIPKEAAKSGAGK